LLDDLILIAMNQPSETMKRGDFLRNLGLSAPALMAVYCLGTLSSCSGGSDDPTPGPGTGPGTGTGSMTGFSGNADPAKGAVNFTLDLTTQDFSKLKTAGEFVGVDRVVVANANGTMVAVGRSCTHQAGQLTFRRNNNDFICDNHGGLFNLNGTVKAAPPTQAVPSYKTELIENGNKLRVTT